MDILRIIEDYNNTGYFMENVLNLKYVAKFDQKIIVLKNPKLLITIGKEDDCEYQDLLENYLKKNIFNIYAKLKIT